jgi:hypothetical protein
MAAIGRHSSCASAECSAGNVPPSTLRRQQALQEVRSPRQKTRRAHQRQHAADTTDDLAYACTTLVQVLPDEMLLMVQQEMEAQNAAAVWSKLTAHFERKTMASRAHTRAQLHHIRMHGGEKFDICARDGAGDAASRHHDGRKCNRH